MQQWGRATWSLTTLQQEIAREHAPRLPRWKKRLADKTLADASGSTQVSLLLDTISLPRHTVTPTVKIRAVPVKRRGRAKSVVSV